MNEPLFLLITGIMILILIAVFFFPRKGLIDRWKFTSMNKRKVRIEDALKYLYNCEYNSINCSLEGVAGNLSISSDEAVEIVNRLEKMGLVRSENYNLLLTDEGRSYALRVIRVHRLWERYLADETSTNETEWHNSAELIEHQMSLEEADQLAAQIGNPVFDPHGDPIPTSSGDIPVKRGKPLSELKPGEFAHIVHVEDEPNYIYSQLVAEGLYAGMQIRMLESSEKRIKFLANGEEVVLAPLFANNISVAPVKGELEIRGKFKSLTSLKQNEKGIVLGISKSCRGQQRRRLMDLGIVPGTEISVEMKSIGGDPVAYRIKGAVVALRKEQTDKIYLKDIVNMKSGKKEMENVLN